MLARIGAEAVSRDRQRLAAFAVDGKPPPLLCLPEDPDEVAAALRLCSEAGAAVIAWGGGTAMAVGNLPRAFDVALGLNRLNRVIEHDHANLTATVQSGVTCAALQQVLASENQFLPFDPPDPERATVGGTVAANLNGPRRRFYGSVRDLVIGIKVVLASGKQIKAGGKVVKNVAGYDLCKLFIGSLGTLGIVTELTARVAPLPEGAATVTASGTLPQVLEFSREISHTLLLPAAVILRNLIEPDSPGASQTAWQIAVSVEGFEPAVARHLDDFLATAARMAMGAAVLRDQLHQRFWRTFGAFSLQPNRVIYRATVPSASLGEVVRAIQDSLITDCPPAIVSDAAAGTIWISLAGQGADPKYFKTLIDLARQKKGHVIIQAAPPGFKTAVDVWGEPPASFSLMRAIKCQFDPQDSLNPGRFVGGL